MNLEKVKIYSRVMRDFVGMDDVSENAKFALLDFSYNLTLGKLDEAYRSVKAIDRFLKDNFDMFIRKFVTEIVYSQPWNLGEHGSNVCEN